MDHAGSEILQSACPLDCPDSCSLDVTVADGRVRKIEGSQTNPLTAGFICSKVRSFHEHVYGQDRLLYPGLRSGPRGQGEFRRVSWDEAFDKLAERVSHTLERHGGEAILPFSYGGSNGYLSQDATDARLFYRLGASRLAHTVCAAATARAVEGLYGKMSGVALEDFVHARLIVVWGANPSVSGIHLVPLIREARKRGAKLAVVDPRRTPLAAQADLHLAPRPGTDLPVALAVARWLFKSGSADLEFLAEETTGWEELKRRAAPWTFERAAAVAGLDAADLETFARLYASSFPALIRCGWGQERNRNGGSATAAILALPAVAGKLGVRGGGYTLSNSSAWGLSSESVIATATPTTRRLNMNLLGQLLLNERKPPIELLFVYNSNPLATLPEQEKVRAGLERDDLFTVVFDQVMTDTARYADPVLPATTFLERRELRCGYGAMVLQDAPAVVAPVGDARSNHEVFAELSRRLGLARPGDVDSAEDMVAELLASSGRADEIRADLDERRISFAFATPPIQMVDVRPRTTDGKIHLVPSELDDEAPEGLYAYREDPATALFPLALISPATNRTVSTMLGQLYRKQVAVEMHSDDAATRGIAGGDEVRVWNDLGEVRCRARIVSALQPGVLCLSKGIWSHNTLNGSTSNALVPATLTDLAGGACFNDARVEVEKV